MLSLLPGWPAGATMMVQCNSSVWNSVVQAVGTLLRTQAAGIMQQRWTLQEAAAVEIRQLAQTTASQEGCRYMTTASIPTPLPHQPQLCLLFDSFSCPSTGTSESTSLLQLLQLARHCQRDCFCDCAC